MEQIEKMRPAEAEEYIAELYGDELYGLGLDGEMSGEGAMRCACSPVHDQVRGICDRLGLDYARVDREAAARRRRARAAPRCNPFPPARPRPPPERREAG